MFVSARFDPLKWYPRPGEGLLEYWASLTPMAPLFGVNWRFGDVWLEAPLRDDAPASSPIRADAEDAEVVEAPAATAAPAAAVAPAAPAAEAAPAAPVADAAPATADDLTRIKGIGPKMADKLAAAGITRFAQIADWDDADIRAMDASLGGLPGAIVRQDWVGQARALAS